MTLQGSLAWLAVTVMLILPPRPVGSQCVGGRGKGGRGDVTSPGLLNLDLEETTLKSAHDDITFMLGVLEQVAFQRSLHPSVRKSFCMMILEV
jgi:hypothetical protein